MKPAAAPTIRQAKPKAAMNRTFAILTTVWLALAAAAPSARAGVQYVPNASFESQATPFADPRVDSWEKPPQPGTFDTNVFGDWDNLAGVFMNAPATNADYIFNCDGNQLAYLFSYPQVAFFQDYNSIDWSNGPPTHAFDAVFEPGKSYALTVGLTSSSEEPLMPGATLEISLYYRDNASNMITVAATNVVFDTGVFTNLNYLVDFQVTVPAVQTNDAWAGKNIGIQIMSTVDPMLIGGVWDLDKVRLTENIPVPNFSFESQVTPFADPRVDSWEKAAQPDTFDTNVFGDWDNLVGVFMNAPATNADYIDNADGSQLAFLFNYPQVALFQDNNSTDWSNGAPTHAFNAKFTAGKAYALTAGLTSSSEEPLPPGATLQMSLYYRDAASNMVTVASTSVVFDTTVFTNLNHLIDFQAVVPEVLPGDACVGKQIGIQFVSTVDPELIGGVWDLDNVRLSETVATALNNPGSTNGHFSFVLQSEPGLAFTILAATDVGQSGTNWTNLGSVANVTGVTSFTDPATNLNQRFYRALQTP